MSEEDINKLIDKKVENKVIDTVTLATNSAIQSLTNLIYRMEQSYINHREEELQARAKHREELSSLVTQQIKVTVNGKIDRLDKKLDELAPVLEQYNENKIVEKRDSKRGASAVKWAGALITIGGAIAIIKVFLINFLK